MIVNRTVAPTLDLVDLALAKQWLKVTDSHEDAIIGALIRRAAGYLDGPSGIVGKALLAQTWTLADAPVTGRTPFVVPVLPLISVTAIDIYDRDNVAQSLTLGDFTTYQTDDWAEIRPNIGTTWPAMYNRPDAITVTATFGFGTTRDAIPGPILQAAEVLVGHFYVNRESGRIPEGVHDLVAGYRAGWVAA